MIKTKHSKYIDDCIHFQNEKNQIMKSNVWLRFVWMDYQLQWDEADYGGIGVLRLPPDKVWKPDIVLFNKYVIYFTDVKKFIYLKY